MLFSFRITVLFGHAKINHVDGVCIFCSWAPYQEIIGLDISVDQIPLVDALYTSDLSYIFESVKDCT